jgi:hypothetical protein
MHRQQMVSEPFFIYSCKSDFLLINTYNLSCYLTENTFCIHEQTVNTYSKKGSICCENENGHTDALCVNIAEFRNRTVGTYNYHGLWKG